MVVLFKPQKYGLNKLNERIKIWQSYTALYVTSRIVNSSLLLNKQL